MIFTITLAYQGKTYTYQHEFTETNDTYKSTEELAKYMYTEGNYACDCNRSNFLVQNCDVSFEGVEGAILDHDYDDGPEWVLPCGDTIKLVSIEPHDAHPMRTTYVQQVSGLYLPVEV